MARPTKNFCDYFPHDRDMRNHRKVKALRNKFGIMGYALWSLFLEYLTGIDGNVFLYDETEFELMSGDFGVSVTEITDVLNYCIKLQLLFVEDGFVKSPSLDENLLPVYEKRNKAKETSKQQQRLRGKFVTDIADATVVSVSEMPQSRKEYSKEEEIKVDSEKELPPKQKDLPEFVWHTTMGNNFSEQAKEKWLTLCKEKKWKGKSESALRESLNKLLRYEEPFAIDLISNAIASGYQGVVFPNTDELYQQWKLKRTVQKPQQQSETNKKEMVW